MSRTVGSSSIFVALLSGCCSSSHIFICVSKIETTKRSNDNIITMMYLTPESESIEAAIKSGENVKVFQSEKRVFLRKFPVFHGFEPTGDTNKAKGVGLILYPGAFVDPTQYSPFARSLAELGYHIAIVNFAFNFAITNFKRAEDVLKYKAWEDIKCWAIAGHSVGGVMRITMQKS